MKEMMAGVIGEGVRVVENGREWRLPCLLYADDLVLCGKSEESLRRLVYRFGKVCKRRSLIVNVDKSKVMVMSEENTQCQIMFIGKQL